ncbi:complex I subunit 5 family protein [Rubrobacter indicoceani]|uniref:complex I subunit 5 family protein n=1 Tax=Rubrobacter indicoceani TaxID=2051957 RepID=UPI000E5C4E5D|nr:proton-conducting transporter membrane subunit [Rubrobacter indicoceani]
MLIALIGVVWFAAVLLSVLDGRRAWVGWTAVAALTVSLSAVFYLGYLILRDGTLEMVSGGWAPGVGIVLRADPLGVTFAALSGFVVLAALVYEVMNGVTSRVFPGMALFLATGLTGLFLTGDAFNFYVFFEISMIASYVLVGYGGGPRQTRAAFIFATVNLLGSVMFLIAVAGLYHLTGTLQMSEIAVRVEEQAIAPSLSIAVVVFVAFGVKLGLFPFHFWLPTVYTGVRPAVAAMLSGALANIGSYGLLRFGGEILPRELEVGSTALIVLGTVSIIYGAVQAISRRRSTEVVAYSAIGQVGYIMIALAIGGPVGYAAAILYSIVNALNKTLLFLCCGLRGWLAGFIFVVGVFSVAGLPPASGFLGKAALFQAGVVEGSPVLVALVFLGGALSFIYMFQIYQRTYWAGTEDIKIGSKPSPVRIRTLTLTIALLILATGLWPEPLLFVSEQAASVLTGGR